MEQTNTHDAGNSNSDRRVDSSRWRADAEAADEQTRQRAEQARQEEEQEQLQRPEAAQGAPSSDPVWQRWREIQSNFVDEPRSAVAEAHALISGIVERAVRQLQEQRSALEQGWSSNKDISTEDLRCSLQSYREFLGRLLSQSQESRG